MFKHKIKNKVLSFLILGAIALNFNLSDVQTENTNKHNSISYLKRDPVEPGT